VAAVANDGLLRHVDPAPRASWSECRSVGAPAGRDSIDRQLRARATAGSGRHPDRAPLSGAGRTLFGLQAGLRTTKQAAATSPFRLAAIEPSL